MRTLSFYSCELSFCWLKLQPKVLSFMSCHLYSDSEGIQILHKKQLGFLFFTKMKVLKQILINPDSCGYTIYGKRVRLCSITAYKRLIIDILQLLLCEEVIHFFAHNDLRRTMLQPAHDKWMNDLQWWHAATLKTLWFFCRELNPCGSRALSHDSIFIPEEPLTEPSLDHTMSQENVSDKVRNLQVGHVLMSIHLAIGFFLCMCVTFYSSLITQRQIAQGIKFGQRPPSLRRSEGDEGSSDEEEAPRSPLKVLAQVEAEAPKTEPKVTTHRLIQMTVWFHF